HKAIKIIKDNKNFYELGFHIFEIGAMYTSIMCKKCGNIDKKNRGGDIFKCTDNKCNYEDNADAQASENILIKWLAYKNLVLENSSSQKIDYWKKFTKKFSASV